jgi:hypothetical protein
MRLFKESKAFSDIGIMGQKITYEYMYVHASVVSSAYTQIPHYTTASHTIQH